MPEGSTSLWPETQPSTTPGEVDLSIAGFTGRQISLRARVAPPIALGCGGLGRDPVNLRRGWPTVPAHGERTRPVPGNCPGWLGGSSVPMFSAVVKCRRALGGSRRTARCRSRASRPSQGEGRDHETYVPTEQPPPVTQARLPPAHVGPCRPPGDPQPPAQGSSPAQRLIVALRRRRDFERLSRDGQQRSAGSLRVRMRAAQGQESARVAFAIPRSVGSAVERNLVRRRLRAIFRDLDRSGRLAAGDYLVIVTPGAVSASFADLRSTVRHLVESRGS